MVNTIKCDLCPLESVKLLYHEWDSGMVNGDLHDMSMLCRDVVNKSVDLCHQFTLAILKILICVTYREHRHQ